MKCPVELNETARGLWDRLVKFLVPTNMLKPVDEVTLAIFCQAWAGWLEANQALEKFGQVMNSPSGYPQQSPFVSIAKNHAETMIKIAKEFGFTLVEMLVVVVIIGIVSAGVLLSVSLTGQDRDLDKESQRLLTLVTVPWSQS